MSTPEPDLSLAVLPVFVPMRGRRAVVLGGTASAAWKGRLLASAGADVHVITETACAELVQLRSVTLHRRPWTSDDFRGVGLVVVAVDTDAEAEGAVAAARASGAIVNAVDRPGLCDVQFGAVVNRSPLVIGISTDGAAPVLAQTLRSMIEALIPVGVGAWLVAAKQWRARLLMLPVAVRKAFWRRFADRALADAGRLPREIDFLELLDAATVGARDEAPAVVMLVSDDPDDLRLADLRVLRMADVIVHDAAVPQTILDFARREARRIVLIEGARRTEIDDAHERGSRRVVVQRMAGGESAGAPPPRSSRWGTAAE